MGERVTGLIIITAAANVWMIYCIWFRRQPTSLMGVLLEGERGHE